MYPQVESPTSPQDQPMTEPKISKEMPSGINVTLDVDNKHHHHHQEEEKSSDTLKNNMDFKDQVNKKRTSLKIENSSSSLTGTTTTTPSLTPTPSTKDSGIEGDDDGINEDDNDAAAASIIKRDSIINLDNAVRSDNNNDICSDCDNNSGIGGIKNGHPPVALVVDNNKYQRNSRNMTLDDDNANDEDDDECDEEEDDEADYNDLEENGNTDTDSTCKRDSITSRDESSDDYFLCEKFKNSLNENLQNALNDTSKLAALELLSPNEGPLARRYAEIAHFKTTNNRSDSSQLRTRRLLPLITTAGTDSEDGNHMGDDDMQALLPSNRDLSQEDLNESRASLVSSSDGGILAEGETSSESSGDSTSPPCDLGLVERLLRTHPVWFLPGIQRAGAVHLLQGKEEGNFVVRGSSQANTMAVSVRLPPDTGPYIEHYLIQSNIGLLSLESSRFKFDSIPALIAHYAQCCDELPVQLTLPRALREAKNRQQLSSLALLGQEFWRYPMASPKPSTSTSPTTQLNSKTDSSGIGTTVFSTNNNNNNNNNNHNNHNNQHSHKNAVTPLSHLNAITPSSGATTANNVFSPTNTPIGIFSQAGTPSDTASSLSSFTSTGQQMMSPESVDSVMLTMSPVDNCRTGIVGKTSTFKAQNRKSMDLENTTSFVNTGNQLGSGMECNEMNMRSGGTTRPTPPSTLNLAPLRTPPAPPPRWPKPSSPNSPSTPTGLDGQLPNNFTVTTTVTFSVEGNQNSQIVEVTSPNSNTTFQTISKRLSPEGECKTTVDTLSSQGSKRWQSQSSKDSSQHNRKILSPNSAETPTGRSRRSKARKESKHYQESDILESPQVYCRSALGDKVSDYEDLWSQDNIINSPLNRGPHMSSFRPDSAAGVNKRPDILPETPIVTSLNGNLLSPAGSSASTNSSPPISTKATATVLSPQQPTVPLTPFQQTQQYFNNHQFNNGDHQHKALETKTLFSPTVVPTHPHRAFAVVQELQQQQQQPEILSPMQQSRNRLGLLLPLQSETSTPSADSTITPTSAAQTPVTGPRNKQGSPFYAEPADALGNVIRRSQRNALLPSTHRHSEPAKGPLRMGGGGTAFCQVLSPIESEKSPISGSLDELKKKNQRKARGRLDPWPLDSSWEFMGIDGDDNDYDTDANWKTNSQQQQLLPKATTTDVVQRLQQQQQQHPPPLPPPIAKKPEIKDMVPLKPLTVHQIILKRMPDLNLPELIKCSTPPTTGSPDLNRNSNGSIGMGSHAKYNRISSYDNVEKGHSGYGTSMMCHGSANSDDGTVFSEPWDSSQWDSFLPHDDTSESIHLSKCRAALCNSEDDTIMEEPSFTTTTTTVNQNNLQPQKLATILRSRSCRDREVLCHPRNKPTITNGPGDSIGAYALALANDSSSTFSRNVENFISCTKESRELAPQVVMRNMRQFMSGMKNYLVKHGEGDFQSEVLRARSRLKADEFLNLDQILEGVMHQLVVLPLKEHLYGLFVDYYTRTADIQLLVENVKYASSRSATDFGIRASVSPPSSVAMHQISLLLLRLQEAELPLDKLEYLLAVVTAIFETSTHPRGQALGADDFLPLLVYIVAKCGFIGAEIEAEFMWCLLQQSLLNGEAGYYLTALCSAVHVLKSFMASENEGTGSLDIRSSSLPACSSVLRVIIPDEYNGSLQTRTLPVRPHTTTREVCRTIAHKARITNPQDYGLFKLVDGEETLLMDTDCPQEARLAARGKHCMLAYKRIDAKIAWPTLTSN